MDGAYRVSLTLPAQQAVLLNDVAKRLGASQSALVSILLEDRLLELSAGLGSAVAPDVAPRRWGGPNVDVLRQLIDEAFARAAQAPPLL